jgi:hypothetical protein
MTTFTRLPTEEQMADAIKTAVELRGGRCWHARDSRGQNLTDLPDLIIMLPDANMVVFIELKSQYRKLTEGQQTVLKHLSQCHEVMSLVVRPRPIDDEISYDDCLQWLTIPEAGEGGGR